MKKSTIAIISEAAVILLLLFLVFYCNRPCPEGISYHTTDTFWKTDSFISLVPAPVPSGSKPPSVPPDTFWKDVDTLKILEQCKGIYNEHYSYNYYDRVLMDNADAYISLQDTTHKNKLGNATVKCVIKRPTIINNSTTIYGEVPRVKVYLGADLSYNIRDSTMGFAPNVFIAFKKPVAVSAGYDIFRREAKAGLYYNILYKKPKNLIPNSKRYTE